MTMHTKYKGHLGEFVAIALLYLKGYRILERRYKTACGEIDIIAKRGNTVVFVEVKARKNVEKCFLAINPKQMNRIRQASLVFLRRNPRLADSELRFDVILVAEHWIPRHIQNVDLPAAGNL
ncbi:MAG: YraN family protein [Holosporaceae bacterium]|jgi:putative endonuclease|nr:YraN family protein [Holosporaceae bacterium]